MAGKETKPKITVHDSRLLVNTNAGSAKGTKSIARSFVIATPASPKLQIGATTR